MEPILYKITRPIIKAFTNIVFRPTYKGLDNIPLNGRVILAGNHTNNFDSILLISSTKRVVHFLAKDSLSKGFKKIIFNNMGIIPVNRKIHDNNAYKIAVEALNQEKAICIFPEGTINRGKDTIMPFKSGAVRMSKESNSYIVPFTIKGKYKPFKKSVEIEFYKPFKAIGNKDKDNEKLMNIIKRKLAKEK